jgi:hypothetical protein
MEISGASTQALAIITTGNWTSLSRAIELLLYTELLNDTTIDYPAERTASGYPTITVSNGNLSVL